MRNGKVNILDWYDKLHRFTPEQLLDLIQSDDSALWGWIAPAGSIVRATIDPDFPEDIASQIKIRMLNHFARTVRGNPLDIEQGSDFLAVAYCYYTVQGRSGKVARRNYRRHLLEGCVMEYQRTEEERRYHGRPFLLDPSERDWYEGWIDDAMRYFPKYFGSEIYRWRPQIHAKLERDYKLHLQIRAQAAASQFAEAQAAEHQLADQPIENTAWQP